MPLTLSILSVLHLACAAAYLGLAGLIVMQARRSQTGLWLAGASFLTAIWAASVAWHADNPFDGVPSWLVLARGIGWFGFLMHLYYRAVPGERTLSPLAITIGMLAVLSLAATPLLNLLTEQPGSLLSLSVLARLGLAVTNILLLENVYFNTDPARRRRLGPLCIGLGVIFAYDLVLYSDAVLFRQISSGLFIGRASVCLLAAPLIGVAAVRNRGWDINIHLSRDVVFHSATLIGSGVFLIGLALGGEILRQTGADWGVVAEISLICAGVLCVGMLLTSGAARARLRSLIIENFFAFRYDYRQEWMRCIQTLSSDQSNAGLQTRAIRAVAQVVDCHAGALYVRDPGAAVFQWAGSWNMPAASRPLTLEDALVRVLEDQPVAELDNNPKMAEAVAELPESWLAIPLRHLGRVIGIVVLQRGPDPVTLDREATDLLGVVGREVASHVVEQRTARALSEARQLREYSKRFAFVVHDIKNVAGQLSMLLSNAERHAANPAFQRDMLTTIRASVARISAMQEKLQRAREAPEEARMIAPSERLASVLAECRALRGADIRLELDSHHANVVMDAEAFDSLIAHLLDNAIEASNEVGGRTVAPVLVVARHENLSVVIDIVDQGKGMTPEFIRDELFAPLRSTKQGGQGIGVFQARELLREAGGDLIALSRPGAGTTMRLLLPTVAAARS